MLGLVSYKTLELVIGVNGNTQTILRDAVNGQVVQTVETPNILNQAIPLYFWLSWKGGLVEFGSGSIVRESRILHWQFQNDMNVNALSFSTETRCWGDWTFNQIHGQLLQDCCILLPCY